MIDTKRIINKIYEGKELMGFTYLIKFGDNETQEIVFRYDKATNAWNLKSMFDRTQMKDSQIYSISYLIPTKQLPLTTLIATGLRYYKMVLEDEIQNKSLVNFALGEEISGQ